MSLGNSSVATIKTRIEKGDLRPYDGYSPSELFVETLSIYPELSENLSNQLESNPDWISRAEHTQICFLLNESVWKTPKDVPSVPKLQLELMGVEKIPTISIDL